MNSFIEYVCTANIGRSKPSELIANAYLKRIGAFGSIQATSSGSMAADIEAGRIPEARKIGYVQMGIDRGDVLLPAQVTAFNTALEKGNRKVIDHFYRIVEHKFHDEEFANRAEAIKYFGIEGELNEQGTQTVADRDRIVVLPMANSNKKAVEEIYRQAGFRPPMGIHLVGEFADAQTDVPDAFGKGRDEYFSTIEALLDFVPRTVDRVLKDAA